VSPLNGEFELQLEGLRFEVLNWRGDGVDEGDNEIGNNADIDANDVDVDVDVDDVDDDDDDGNGNGNGGDGDGDGDDDDDDDDNDNDNDNDNDDDVDERKGGVDLSRKCATDNCLN